MKKRTKTAVTVVLVLLGVAVVPTAASAHKLPFDGYVRSAAESEALDWYLSGSQWDQYWVDTCYRYSQHKTSCDANVQGTTYGDFHCGYTTCWETDTTTTCWKRVWAAVGHGYKVRYRTSFAHCSTQRHTDYF